MHRIISIGELLWDILPDKTILGGAPANLAFRLAEIGNSCYLVSRLGKDEMGRRALEILNELRLKTDYIQWDDAFPTGSVDVFFDSFKNPDYVINPNVAYDRIEFLEILQEIAPRVDCIAYGTLAQRAPISRKTIRRLLEASEKPIKFLDINFRKDCFSRETVEHSLEFADVLKLNHHEVWQLRNMFGWDVQDFPEAASKLIAGFDVKTVIVTLEETGVYCQNKEGHNLYVPGYNAPLEDPLGAGDAFSAGFIDSILKNQTLHEACERGNLMGAVVAMHKGATQKITDEEIHFVTNRCKRISNFDGSFALMNVGKDEFRNPE